MTGSHPDDPHFSGSLEFDSKDRTSHVGLKFPLLILIFLLMMIGGGGYFTYEKQSRIETGKIDDNIKAVAKLKAGQINRWIAQAKTWAMVSSKASPFADRIREWQARGALSDAGLKYLRARLDAVRQLHPDSVMTLLDANEEVIVTTGDISPEVAGLQPLMRRAVDARQAVMGDMRWSIRKNGEKYISLPIASPLIASGENERIVGILLIEFDVNQFLFPLIQSWPTPSKTAETLLFMRDGNEALFLNELRHRQGTALTLRIPLDSQSLLAAQVVRGASGFISGTDYRDESVIGHASKIPETNWYMVAKIDSDEVYEPLRSMAFIRAVFVFLIFLIASFSLFFWWRSRNAQWEKRNEQYRTAQLQHELDRQLLSSKFDCLSKYANDIILLLDEHGRILEANDRAETAYGFTRQQLIGKNILDLRSPSDMAMFEKHWNYIKKNKGLLFEICHVRSDGAEFPVEINSRTIETGQGLFVQNIIRDITERKTAQAREQRLMNIYRALSVTNEAIIHIQVESDLFALVCKTAVEYGGMTHAWIGAPTSEGQFVPTAQYGIFTHFSNEIIVRSRPDSPEGRGPSGIAYRENRPVVVNDALNDELTAPWRERARIDGTRAIAVYPIPRGSKPYMVFSIYSDQAGAFDDEIADLLQEMAANIAFALDNYDRDAARRESEKTFRALFENSPDSIFFTFPDGRITDANPAACAMLGMSLDEIIRAGRKNILEDTAALQAGLQERALKGKATVTELTFIRKDGTRFPAEVSSVVLAEPYEAGRSFVIARDITGRKKTEEELKLAAMVYQDSSEAMMVTGGDNLIMAVNPAFERITGYSADEVVGDTIDMLKSGLHDDEFYHSMRQALHASGYWKGEIWNNRKSGEVFAALTTINTISNDDGSVKRRVVLINEITEKKRSEGLIWTQANFDALTGLPNRRLFREHLQQEIRKARRSQTPLALMFLDLDGFKHVNDTLGHDFGDILLKEAAHRLQSCMRNSDTVARLGGDEFTIILSELHDPGNAARIARHVLSTLSEPFLLGKKAAYVSASIGITFYPEDATEIEDLIKNADQAMYAAKHAGKNRYHCFTLGMQEEANSRMLLVNDLRSALDGNQFEIVYQPIVELSSGGIHKAEALIRWRHPTRGLINPLDFISVAEETGMIASFGNWIFHEAATQAALWREKYHPSFQISINISPVQFKDEGIDSSAWLERLKELDLPGQSIAVEITEGLLLDSSHKITDQLSSLRMAGIEITLDDFGTAYSSLSYLKKFDIDYIKIDQTFVRNLTAESDDMALCEAIIVMAHKLGIKVVAEGVETDIQHELLANAGCEYAQGFLFSKPVPAEAFERLLKASPFASQELLEI